MCPACRRRYKATERTCGCGTRLKSAGVDPRPVASIAATYWLRRTLAVAGVLGVTSALMVADVFRSPELEWKAAAAARSGLPAPRVATAGLPAPEEPLPLPPLLVLPAPPLPPDAEGSFSDPIAFAPTATVDAPTIAMSPAPSNQPGASTVPLYTDRDLARVSHAVAEPAMVQRTVPIAAPPADDEAPDDDPVTARPPPDEDPSP